MWWGREFRNKSLWLWRSRISFTLYRIYAELSVLIANFGLFQLLSGLASRVIEVSWCDVWHLDIHSGGTHQSILEILNLKTNLACSKLYKKYLFKEAKLTAMTVQIRSLRTHAAIKDSTWSRKSWAKFYLLQRNFLCLTSRRTYRKVLALSTLSSAFDFFLVSFLPGLRQASLQAEKGNILAISLWYRSESSVCTLE